MSGPYTAYYLPPTFSAAACSMRNPVLGLVALFLISMATSTLIAVLLERIAYRPLRTAPRLVPLITAIGGVVLSPVYVPRLLRVGVPGLPRDPRWRGTSPWSHPRAEIPAADHPGGGVLDGGALPVRAAAPKIGKPFARSVKTRKPRALMGIDVDRMITMTFVIGGAAAGAPAFCTALMFKQVQFFMGSSPGSRPSPRPAGRHRQYPGRHAGRIFLGLVESVVRAFPGRAGIPAPYS